MANTYTQLYTHIVFAVKGRQNLITKDWKTELYKYITGIVTHKDQKLIIINGMPNHLHILLGLKPNCNLSDLVRDIKSNASKWVNQKNFVKGKFEWQTGFGAFSVSQSHLQNLIPYIENQEHHHRTTSFKEEYEQLLQSYEVDFKEEYLFDDVD